MATAKWRGKTFRGNTDKQDNTLGKKDTHGEPLGWIYELELKGGGVAEHKISCFNPLLDLTIVTDGNLFRRVRL